MDRTFILVSTKAEVKRIPTRILIRSIIIELYYSNKYVVITFYLEGTIKGKTIFTKITREIYVIDDLKAGILIGVDILTLEYIVIDFS